MTIERELLERALIYLNRGYEQEESLIDVIETFLEKPDPEPFTCGSCGVCIERTSPPAQKRLSDERIDEIIQDLCLDSLS